VTRVIRTVRGDIDPSLAGVVDSHDHLFLTAATLPGEELDDEEAAASELRAFAAAGGGTIVQWTPRGMRRGLPALRRLSESTGIHVVAATGRHRAVVYAGDAFDTDVAPHRLARAFIDDIAGRSCGLIKVGVGHEIVAPEELASLRAAAIAHHATGVPIAIHLEQGSAAGLVLDALFREGVPPRSIVLGHLGRNPDLRRIIEAAQSGTWLCLDAPSPGRPVGAGPLATICAALVDRGHLDQLLVGADTTVASARSNRSEFGPAALLTSALPRLTDALDRDAASRIVTENPARAWAWES
jgi:phosphotriesterase-related protein